MIKNILFDMGNVLIRWDPPLFIRRMGITGEDHTILMNELFNTIEWVQLDNGLIDEEGLLELVQPRIPERLHKAARELVMEWDKPAVIPIEGMEELVAELHKNGYGLYLLSNASVRHPLYWSKVPVSGYFGDNLLVSAFIKVMKPEREFYETALSRFDLNADECIFIDDNPANCAAAVKCGIRSIVSHQDAQLLRIRLREYGVNI